MNFRKSYIAVALAIMSVLCVGMITNDSDESSADTYGDWTYTVSDGVATITAYNGSSTSLNIPSSVNGYPVRIIGNGSTMLVPYGFGNYTVVLPEGVTTISNSAFNGGQQARVTGDLVIPSTVTTIGTGAFASSRTTSITLNEGLVTIGASAFSDITTNTSTTLNIPNSVTTIGQYAFRYMAAVTTVNLGYSVTSIGSNAFQSNTITDVYNYSQLTITAGSYGFPALATIHNIGMPTDGDWKFIPSGANATIVKYTGNATTNIIVPSTVSFNSSTYTVTEIGDGSNNIWGNGWPSSSATLTLPNTLLSINDNSMWGNGASNTFTGSLVIPDSVTYIGNSSLNANGFTSVVIGNSVATIGTNAFNGWGNATGTLTIPDSVTSIGTGAFSSTGFTGLVLSKNLTSIPDSAFQTNHFTGTIRIPNSVTSIGHSAFLSSYMSLDKLIVGNGVSSISTESFQSATINTVINLSSTVVPTSAQYGPFITTTYSYPGYQYDSDWIFGMSGDNAILRQYIGSAGTITLPTSLSLEGVSKTVSATGDGTNPIIPAGLSAVVVIPSAFTTVAPNTFNGCAGITSVTLTSVTTVGASAFNGCSGLSSIDLTGITSIGDYGFANCTGLSTLTIPDSVVSIGNYAFAGCSNVSSLVIGAYVTSIGTNAFQMSSCYTVLNHSPVDVQPGTYGLPANANVTKLETEYTDGDWKFYVVNGYARAVKYTGSSTSLTIPNTLDVSGTSYTVNSVGLGAAGQKVARCNSVTFPSSVVSINAYAFDGARLTTAVTLPSGLTYLGEYAFANNAIGYADAGITIPSTLSVIGNNAFDGYGRVYTLNLGNVTTIGDYAFRNTLPYSNTSITIPDSVVTIGDYAFEGNEIAILTLGSGLTNIGAHAFDGSLSMNHANLSIPDTVVYIGEGAFKDAEGINNLLIGTGLTTIQADCFRDSEIGYVLFLNNVSNVGAHAFDGCGLTGIFYDNVVYVGDYAFRGNSFSGSFDTMNIGMIGEGAFEDNSIVNLVIRSSVTSIGDDAFKGNPMSEVLNLSDVSLSGKVPSTATVRSSIPGDWYITDIEVHEPDDSETSALILIIPTFVILGIIVGAIRYVQRTRGEYGDSDSYDNY